MEGGGCAIANLDMRYDQPTTETKCVVDVSACPVECRPPASLECRDNHDRFAASGS